MTVDSWIPVYAGANWHERETHEMFGIHFAGHPDLRNMYLPTDFEGYPLRKDFPLLARIVKPWPGIVDVEPLPAEEAPPQDEVAGEVAPRARRPSRPSRARRAAGRGRRRRGGAEHSVEEAPDSSDARTDTATDATTTGRTARPPTH